MSCTRALLVAALVVCAPPVARADETQLDAFLTRLDARRASLVDFTAQFRQRQYAALFGDVKLSSGTLKFRAPDAMLWEYLEPDKSFLRVSPDEVQFYFPLLEQVEVYAVADQRSMRSLLASFTQPTTALRADYDLAYLPPGTATVDFAGETVALPDAPGLTMRPHQDEMRAQFTRVDFWVRPDSFMLCLLVLTEPGGDTTTFLFEEVRTNTGLTDAALSFHAPPGTTIVRNDPAS